MAEKELQDVIEIVRGRLYLATCRSVPAETASCVFFSSDDDLRYDNFYADFGPLNLAMLFKYCQTLLGLLRDPSKKHKQIYHVTRMDHHKRPNAAYLIGAFSVIYLGRTPDAAYKPLAHLASTLHPFRDASYGTCTFKLTILDCLRGVFQALLLGFLDFSTFDIVEYQHFERVENGDLNWVVPKMFIAFAGPHHIDGHDNGYPIHSPEFYFDYFRRNNVTDIVRLNQKLYERERFVAGGFQHHELYFIDGGIPPEHILTKFLDICEHSKGGVAVHCKAGLGRTGTLIACYMMKHYLMTATECIAWLRIARPGSVIGPQQFYLQEKQAIMWMHADPARKRLQDDHERPAWAREVLANLVKDGCLVFDAEPAGPAAKPAIASLLSAMHIGSRAAPAPHAAASAPAPALAALSHPHPHAMPAGPAAAVAVPAAVLREEILRATEVVDGRSQGDLLIAQKAKALRTRSITTGTLQLDGSALARTRHGSASSPTHVTNMMPHQQAPLKTSKVKRPDGLPPSSDAVSS